MRFERNDYKIDSRTAEAGPKTFDRRTGSFCQSRPYRSRRAVGKSRTGNSPGLVGRAMEMIGRAGTLRIKRHFFRPVARFFCRHGKKMYICRTIPLQDEYNIPFGRMPRAGRARWKSSYCLKRNGLKMRKMIRQRLSDIRTS